MEIRLKIKDKYAARFLAFLKTLDYVTIEKAYNTVRRDSYGEGGVPTGVHESKTVYGKKNKLSAGEIEQLIIAKALSDARKIERGELTLKSYDNYKDIIADLKAEIETDNEILTNQ